MCVPVCAVCACMFDDARGKSACLYADSKEEQVNETVDERVRPTIDKGGRQSTMEGVGIVQLHSHTQRMRPCVAGVHVCWCAGADVSAPAACDRTRGQTFDAVTVQPMAACMDSRKSGEGDPVLSGGRVKGIVNCDAR
jgi:hypothetical protein